MFLLQCDINTLLLKSGLCVLSFCVWLDLCNCFDQQNMAGMVLPDYQSQVIKGNMVSTCFFLTLRTLVLEIHVLYCEEVQATWRSHMELLWLTVNVNVGVNEAPDNSRPQPLIFPVEASDIIRKG